MFKVKFPKSQRLGKCTEYSALEERRMQVQCVEDDQALRTALRFHFTYVTEERLSFVQQRTDAETYPHLFMSLIIDFCEKVPLPH